MSITIVRKQHSRARAERSFCWYMFSVLSPLYAPTARICLAEPVYCHRPTLQ